MLDFKLASLLKTSLYARLQIGDQVKLAGIGVLLLSDNRGIVDMDVILKIISY